MYFSSKHLKPETFLFGIFAVLQYYAHKIPLTTFNEIVDISAKGALFLVHRVTYFMLQGLQGESCAIEAI